MRIEDTFCKGKNSMSLLFQYKEGKNRSLTGPGGYPRETCSSYADITPAHLLFSECTVIHLVGLNDEC